MRLHDVGDASVALRIEAFPGSDSGQLFATRAEDEDDIACVSCNCDQYVWMPTPRGPETWLLTIVRSMIKRASLDEVPLIDPSIVVKVDRSSRLILWAAEHASPCGFTPK